MPPSPGEALSHTIINHRYWKQNEGDNFGRRNHTALSRFTKEYDSSIYGTESQFCLRGFSGFIAGEPAWWFSGCCKRWMSAIDVLRIWRFGEEHSHPDTLSCAVRWPPHGFPRPPVSAYFRHFRILLYIGTHMFNAYYTLCCVLYLIGFAWYIQIRKKRKTQ